MGNEGIADQATRLILPCSKGNVLTYSKRPCIQTLSQFSAPGIRMYLNAGKVLAKDGLHVGLHPTVEGMASTQLGLNSSGIAGFCRVITRVTRNLGRRGYAVSQALSFPACLVSPFERDDDSLQMPIAMPPPNLSRQSLALGSLQARIAEPGGLMLDGAAI
jgi:hypothetical protein